MKTVAAGFVTGMKKLKWNHQIFHLVKALELVNQNTSPPQSNSDSDRGSVFPIGFILRNDTIHIFPSPRWLLITGYQKLKTNSYRNSIFLLKANLASYIWSSWSIVLLYIVQMQQWWKEVGGAWPQGWLQKHSAFFSCHASMRHSTLLKWICSLFHLYVQPPWCLSRTVTWGWLPCSKSQFPPVPGLPGWLAAGPQDSQTVTPANGACITKIHHIEAPKPSVWMFWPHMNFAETCIWKSTRSV